MTSLKVSGDSIWFGVKRLDFSEYSNLPTTEISAVRPTSKLHNS
jgi:hypothetical protein